MITSVEPAHYDRRDFLRGAALASGALGFRGAPVRAAARPLHLSCNQYVWFIYYQREKKNLSELLDTALGEMASVGLDGFEPSVGSPAELESLGALTRKHGLELRSLYVNSTLHEATQVEKSVTDILAIARKARALGTRIIVTNPSPIRWGGPENKTDGQLECQAEAMDRLGRELAGLGLRLAYHNHDIELRNAAREFHHMLAGTDPQHVHLCLDAHWVYRGSGDSQVALLDVVRLYGRRIVELHVRQSRGGVWTETLEDGDVDYSRLVRALVDLKLKPHVVLEQAVENGTPNTMNVVEAQRRTVVYARRVFSPLAVD
jgi:inosose dehydratase